MGRWTVIIQRPRTSIHGLQGYTWHGSRSSKDQTTLLYPFPASPSQRYNRPYRERAPPGLAGPTPYLNKERRPSRT
ncbi:hypothetical protein OH76DRAFT_805579 [Lentinus brumalis]|uniref:Uncharacterized protein n=1 Tax=Lentinus brumalis TaxID=2498619 RepID=A0A371D2R4_9APHY|nr:hypothetical protein OH76DRAFT_805579 [Polyporus brumalis]